MFSSAARCFFLLICAFLRHGISRSRLSCCVGTILTTPCRQVIRGVAKVRTSSMDMSMKTSSFFRKAGHALLARTRLTASTKTSGVSPLREGMFPLSAGTQIRYGGRQKFPVECERWLIAAIRRHVFAQMLTVYHFCVSCKFLHTLVARQKQ